MLLKSVSLVCFVVAVAASDWKDEKPKEHHHEHHEHVKSIVVTKKVPKPYPVEVEKPVPYEVKVPVDKPYPVYVPQPYTVYVEKKVPYEVKVPVPKPYVVEKKIPYEVKVQVDKPYPVEVPKPYNVYVEKKVPYYVEKKVPYKVQVPVEKKYPVHYPVEKNVPVPVIKEVPYEVKVPVDKPVPYKVEKPVPYQVEKIVRYPVVKEVPYPVHVPYPVEVKVPVKVSSGYEGSSSFGTGSYDSAWKQLSNNAAATSYKDDVHHGSQDFKHGEYQSESGGYATSYANQHLSAHGSVLVKTAHQESSDSYGSKTQGSDDSLQNYNSASFDQGLHHSNYGGSSEGKGSFSSGSNTFNSQHFSSSGEGFGDVQQESISSYKSGFENSWKPSQHNIGVSSSAVHGPSSYLYQESLQGGHVSSGSGGFPSSHLVAPRNHENQGSSSGDIGGNVDYSSSPQHTEAIFESSPYSSSVEQSEHGTGYSGQPQSSGKTGW